MPKRRRILLFGGGIAVFLTVIGVIIMGTFSVGSQLVVESDTESSVYVDNNYVGAAPVSYETRAQQVVVKIIPKESRSGYLPYETALSLTPQTKVIVRHNFGNDARTASTQILSLIKRPQKGAFFTVVTNPPNALIFFNNEYVGTSPLHIEKEPSTYSVQVVHEGFQALHLSLKNSSGYDLSTYIDLAKPLESDNPKNTTTFATIAETPVGFLNVHTEPQESSSQIARIFAGHEYPLKSYSQDKKWIEIALNDFQSGWILSKYASVSGQTATPP